MSILWLFSSPIRHYVVCGMGVRRYCCQNTSFVAARREQVFRRRSFTICVSTGNRSLDRRTKGSALVCLRPMGLGSSEDKEYVPCIIVFSISDN